MIVFVWEKMLVNRDPTHKSPRQKHVGGGKWLENPPKPGYFPHPPENPLLIKGFKLPQTWIFCFFTPGCSSTP